MNLICASKHLIFVAAVAIILLSAYSSFAEKITYTYNALNRLTDVQYTGWKIHYDYDEAGNRTKKTVTSVVAQSPQAAESLKKSGQQLLSGSYPVSDPFSAVKSYTIIGSKNTNAGSGSSPVGSSSAAPIDNWHVINPSTSTYTINACAYGAGKLVAVAEHAKILIFDGKKWTIKNTLKTFRAIAYGNNMFVAVGDSGAVLISDNGLDWRIRPPDTSQTLRGITFADEKFVAVGDNGTILTSPYGTAWTIINPLTSNTLRAVAFCNIGYAKFAAVGDNGTVLTSSHGVDWTIVDSGLSESLRAVAFGNEMFVAAGDNGSIFTSADGATWMPASSGTTETLNGAAFGNDLFVVVGSNGLILSSYDGAAWTSRGPVTSDALYGAAFNDGLFAAGGDNGIIIQSDKTAPRAPHIQVSPASIDFGKVFLGTGVDPKTLTITNTGDAALYVSPAAIKGANSSEFSQYDECYVKPIGPSESCDIYFYFIPERKGQCTATIFIKSEDAAHPELKIPMKGIAKMPFTIRASAGEGGRIKPDGTILAQKNDDRTFTISSYLEYDLVDVKVDGVSKGAITSYDFTNVTANHKISATFRIKTYKIAASAGPNGRIVPSGAVKLNYGTDKTFSIKPAKGYKIADVVVDGKSVGAVSTYLFKTVEADHTIEATFTQK